MNGVMETLSVQNTLTAEGMCQHQQQQELCQQQQQQQKMHRNDGGHISVKSDLHSPHQGEINPAFIVSSDDVISASKTQDDVIGTENLDTLTDRGEPCVSDVQTTPTSVNEYKETRITGQSHLPPPQTTDEQRYPQAQCFPAGEPQNHNNKPNLGDLNDVFDILTRRNFRNVTLSEISKAAASLQERAKCFSKNVYYSGCSVPHTNTNNPDRSRRGFEPDGNNSVVESRDTLSTSVKSKSGVNVVIPEKTNATAAADTSVTRGENNQLDPHRVEFDVSSHLENTSARDSAVGCVQSLQGNGTKVSNRQNESRHFSVFTISDVVEGKWETTSF